MKRILIFSLSYKPFWGGAELAIREITDRLPEEFEFHLVTLRFDSALPPYERVGRVHVHRIGFGRKGTSAAASFSPLFYLSKIFFVPLAALKGRSLHRKYRFDGAWAMMSYMLFPLVLMRLCGIRLPYALTLQEGDTFERTFGRLRIALFMPLLRFGFRHAAVVQAISSFLAQWARSMGFSGELAVIPNGVDVARFSFAPSPEARASMRTKLGAAQDDFLLITTSRLVKKNAVDVVIEALRLLPARARFAVLGDGPELESLKLLAQEEGVAERVQFLGSIPYEKLPEYLHAADLFVRPSRSEGMGNSFIEAMSAGLPVIATQVGGIADFLFDPERNPEREPTGLATLPDDAAGVAEAVTKLMEDAELARTLSRNGQRLAAARYDWSTIADEMRERVFSKLS